MIHVLLVDDEEPARARLRRLLAAFEDVEVVGEASDGEEAMERIAELKPDLVLLDIQMPGCGGMEVAASLPSPRPAIVFCTAYDEFAVDAFELHAVDYLLKPVNRARLEKALERVREPGGDDRLRKLAAVARPARFLARRANRFFVVPTARVLFFGSEGGLTRLQTAEHHYWMQPTLAELEGSLDPDAFFRISRAAIVRLEAVREVVPEAGGAGWLKLADGTRLDVTRRRFRELLERISGGTDGD